MHAAAPSQQPTAGAQAIPAARKAAAPAAAKTTLAKEMALGRTPDLTSHSESTLAHAVDRDLRGRRDTGCSAGSIHALEAKTPAGKSLLCSGRGLAVAHPRLP